MITDAVLRSCLGRRWQLSDAAVVAHHGGMNSATWFVEQGGRRWVAKSVSPAARDQFVGGLAVAGLLERAGVPAGAAVPTVDGEVVVAVEGRPLALLTWVPGAPLTGADRAGQRVIGRTLGQVHRGLEPVRLPDAERFHWVDPAAGHLGVRGWVRPAVTAAVRALDEVGPETLSWGLLHSDPAPEAFRWDPATGVCGLIDWPVALTGPLLYDLASAVMYVGGPDRGGELVEAYLDEGVLTRAEVDRCLLPMLRFRWAVQADYFARRMVEDDRTGIDGPAGNDQGLEDARRHLVAPGRADERPT